MATKNHPTITELAAFLKAADPPDHTSQIEFEYVQGESGIRILSATDGMAFLYRGQNQRWQPCLAQVWRKGQPSEDPRLNHVYSRARSAEFELLLDKHPMIQFARGKDVELDFDALAQHYGIPTFWLDLTSSIDVACFFAVAKFCPSGEITACTEGAGVLYRVDRHRVMNSQRYFKSISHSPASRPGRQHGWSLGTNRDVDFDQAPFVEAFEFAHSRTEADALIDAYAERLLPRDSLHDVATMLNSCPIVTMHGIKAALRRDKCPDEKLESIASQWAQLLSDSLGLTINMEEHFELTDAQITAGEADAAEAERSFFSEVGFRPVRVSKGH